MFLNLVVILLFQVAYRSTARSFVGLVDGVDHGLNQASDSNAISASTAAVSSSLAGPISEPSVFHRHPKRSMSRLEAVARAEEGKCPICQSFLRRKEKVVEPTVASPKKTKKLSFRGSKSSKSLPPPPPPDDHKQRELTRVPCCNGEMHTECYEACMTNRLPQCPLCRGAWELPVLPSPSGSTSSNHPATTAEQSPHWVTNAYPMPSSGYPPFQISHGQPTPPSSQGTWWGEQYFLPTPDPYQAPPQPEYPSTSTSPGHAFDYQTYNRDYPSQQSSYHQQDFGHSQYNQGYFTPSQGSTSPPPPLSAREQRSGTAFGDMVNYLTGQY
ncbi:hypothetical protein PTTG_02778 [Puccinia triticina 1-1 BBBD Race 1]|uniref:RING-type domain-containing protein n=2 Tax=Puccinia triticina TaxID=208348 RepID=A0A0C4EPS5_PUCT1|nr:uncharacterized protein PtA15_1A812 [Puccinia triticina]OAV96604.1 hypothetical protein PTTG_02778 [Puccinia triticina 1-1 BBBD Race 1]WAQ81470.1 hypothetical protein PtA15_1A812 [Puccinia triticina]WAR52352.1 hypothetical protein PtB15_1B793 [Puccinia triticina]